MKRKTKGWVVVDVDPEITRYYRWWIAKERHIYLCKPSWDAHISVVRGEKLTDESKSLWRAHHGTLVEFEYKQNPRAGKKSEFWTVDVRSDFLDSVRTELGLVTGWKYHITVGRLWHE